MPGHHQHRLALTLSPLFPTVIFLTRLDACTCTFFSRSPFSLPLSVSRSPSLFLEGPGYVAINNFLKGKGWGKEVDTPVPEPWKKENHAASFVLELEVGAGSWAVRLNGEPQPKLSYVRAGLEHFTGPLVLQVYDLLNPRVSLREPIVSS